MLDMSFLTANFGWIILAVVLFAMLIVGYVADKTDFGHKKISKKKEIENPNKVEEIDLENLKGKTLSDMVGGSKEKTETNDINEDLNAPFGDTNTTNENVDSLYTPIGSEDLNAPFGDTSTDIPLDMGTITPTEEVKTEEIVETPVDSDLYAPIGEVEVPNEETAEAVSEISNPEDVTLAPMETMEELETPSEEEVIPSVDEIQTLETPIEEVPIVDATTENEIIPEATEDVVEDVPSVETIEIPEESEKEKKKREKKEKKEKKKHKKDKEQEESNKYTVDYDHEIVPEVITEKFNDGNNEEVSSDDDIWKF